MNFIDKNKQVLEYLKSLNGNYNHLIIMGNELIYNGKKARIDLFDISLLLNEQLPLLSNIQSLSEEDIFSIINVHSITLESKQKSNEEKNEKELEALKEKNPNLKNITISTKKNEYGENEEYINIVDSHGFDRVLHNYYKLDLFKLYEEALNTYQSSSITPEQLYEVFRRRCKEVDLTASYEINNRINTSEEFKAKMNNFDRNHTGDYSHALVNEEHDIIISNDHTVTSYEKDRYGNLVQNDFKNSLDNNSLQDNKVASNLEQEVTPLNVNASENGLSINESDEKIIDLISEEKFYQLINSPSPLSTEQNEQVSLFNSYLEELLLYKEYLLPELKDILARFEIAMNNLSVQEENQLNENQLNELRTYYNMLEFKEQKVKELNGKNLELQVKKLVLKKPKEEAGSVSLVLVMIIVAGALIIAGFMAYMIAR